MLKGCLNTLSTFCGVLENNKKHKTNTFKKTRRWFETSVLKILGSGNLLVYLKLTSYLKNRGCVCISPPDVAGMLPSRGSRPNSMPPSNIDSKVPTQSDTHGRPSSGLSNLGQTGWCFKWIEMEELVRVASGMWSGVWWSHPACSGPSPEAKENST